jgi:predicted RNA-binding protein YlxR (DUF448 family)
MAEDNDATDATLTEILRTRDNPDASEPAKRTHRKDHRGVWVEDDYEALEDDPRNYSVECSCGETFDTWQKAIDHYDNH